MFLLFNKVVAKLLCAVMMQIPVAIAPPSAAGGEGMSRDSRAPPWVAYRYTCTGGEFTVAVQVPVPVWFVVVSVTVMVMVKLPVEV